MDGHDLQRPAVDRGSEASRRAGKVAMRAAHRRGTSKAIRTFGLTAACHAPTSIFDGSSTDELRRHGVGVGCDQAETPRRTPVTLLAAAAVGVCKFEGSSLVQKA